MPGSAAALAAGVLLVAAVALGAVLSSRHLGHRAAPGALRAAHGGLGAAGFALGIAALPPTLSPFLLDGVALLAAALALGLGYWLFAARLGGARGMVLALHGFAGGLGALLLAGWAFGG